MTTLRGRVVKRFSVAKFASKLHYHGCPQCRGRFTCSCATPEDDYRCSTCLGGHPPSSTALAWAPRECCAEHSREATGAERETYKLAGPGPWFVCLKCWRQQPINPRKQ